MAGWPSTRPTCAPPRRWRRRCATGPSPTPGGWTAGTSPSPGCTWTPWTPPGAVTRCPSRGRWPSAWPRPSRTCPAVRHVLLGMNAHINYDLPQALLAVISDAEFGDPQVRALREADHRRIDEVLAIRVGAEDAELQRLDPAATWQDRVLQPLNRVATRRFLRESRAKVWANALELSKARAAGPDSYAGRLAELEKLCGRRVADLERPGPVLLRLAAGGFGVRLAGEGQPPAAKASGRRNGGRTARGAASRAARRAAPARARCGPSTRSRSATWRPTCGSPTTAGSGPGSWCPRCGWCTARSAWTGCAPATGPGWCCGPTSSGHPTPGIRTVPAAA